MSRDRPDQPWFLALACTLLLTACVPVCYPLPEFPCETHDDCPLPDYCLDDGFCAGGRGCRTDATCPDGVPCTTLCETAQGHTYRCPLQPGSCGRLQPCVEDEDCPHGLPCIGLCEDDAGEIYLCDERQEFCSELDPQPRSLDT